MPGQKAGSPKIGALQKVTVRVEMRPGLGCCQDRRRRSGMTHKVTDGSSELVVPPRCLLDVGAGLAHPVVLISGLSAIST
jgi:hypothetical protein